MGVMPAALQTQAWTAVEMGMAVEMRTAVEMGTAVDALPRGSRALRERSSSGSGSSASFAAGVDPGRVRWSGRRLPLIEAGGASARMDLVKPRARRHAAPLSSGSLPATGRVGTEPSAQDLR